MKLQPAQLLLPQVILPWTTSKRCLNIWILPTLPRSMSCTSQLMRCSLPCPTRLQLHPSSIWSIVWSQLWPLNMLKPRGTSSSCLLAIKTDLSHIIADVKIEIAEVTATFINIKPSQSLAPISFIPQFPFIQWESKDFNVFKLTKALADIKLTGDSLCHVKEFYDSICGAFNTALYVHSAFPTYQELMPSFDFYHHLSCCINSQALFLLTAIIRHLEQVFVSSFWKIQWWTRSFILLVICKCCHYMMLLMTSSCKWILSVSEVLILVESVLTSIQVFHVFI